MCTYQNGTYECRGDGYLWDADSDGYDPSECDHACPRCNTREFLERAKEDAESCSYSSSNTHACTGAGIWRRAVAVAQEENAVATQATLASLGVVSALVDDEDHPDGYRVQLFVYAAPRVPTDTGTTKPA